MLQCTYGARQRNSSSPAWTKPRHCPISLIRGYWLCNRSNVGQSNPWTQTKNDEGILSRFSRTRHEIEDSKTHLIWFIYMTRISGTNIVKAPCCGALYSTTAFASINFMASEHWTDGATENSLSQSDGGLRRCHTWTPRVCTLTDGRVMMQKCHKSCWNAY